ncbi:MAG: PIN domain-containing protein [Methylococcales bacterium]|nr:PIN domain-containing protein [Methylococcales bacterium]
MIRVDANYILRYLLNDNPEMANIAEQLFLNEQVFIANEILAEVVYVLLGVYEIAKIDIADKLIDLIYAETILTDNKAIIIEALTIFKHQTLDFVDCLLCSYSQIDEIKSFDKKLNRYIQNKKNKAPL